DEERRSSDSSMEYAHTASPWKPPRFMSCTRKALSLFIADLGLFGAILHSLSPLISLLQHNQDMFPARVKVTSGHLPKAIKLLPLSYSLTWWWAKLQPYAAIMSSTGPLFISLAVADYLYDQPSLPSPTVQVIPPAGLRPYISDLQTATWHGWDAHVLKWLADKPLVWFVLGTIFVVGGVYALNKFLLLANRISLRLFRALMRWIKWIAKI
ncbi:hypothetical protein H9L39_18209, partial [Fusarium oxysporum f. sp. albedinis]